MYDDDDLDSVAKLNLRSLDDIESPLPDQSSSRDHSSRVASPDLSTTSPNVSMTSPEISASNKAPSLLATPNVLRDHNDYNSGYESSLHPSTDDDEEMMEDHGMEEESNDSEASDLDSVSQSDVSVMDHLHSDVDSFLCSDSEGDDESEDLDEDAEFDDYSSEDGASDDGFGFPDETLRSAFWEEIPLKFFDKVPIKDSQAGSSEPREGPNSVERLPLDKFVNPPPPAYSSTSADFVVASSESFLSGHKNSGAVAINTLLNTEKTSSRKQTAATEVDITLPSPAMLTGRDPSPSDAVMPKSCYSAQTEKTRNVAQILGEMTGKGEFFAAREQNKILAKTQRTAEPRSSVYSLCNGASPVSGPFSLDPASTMGQFLKMNVEEIAEATNVPQLPEIHWAEPPLESTPSLEVVSSGQPGDDRQDSSQPLPEVATTGRDVDDQSLRRTHLGISDIVEGCQLAPAQDNRDNQVKQIKQTAKGLSVKRKADDISESTAEEEQWARPVVSGKTNLQKEQVMVLNSPELLSITEESSSKSLTPRTTKPREIDGPPTKRLRRIAERFGYAALGGVTAGAMIFGTLVYTAPTFV